MQSAPCIDRFRATTCAVVAIALITSFLSISSVAAQEKYVRSRRFAPSSGGVGGGGGGSTLSPPKANSRAGIFYAPADSTSPPAATGSEEANQPPQRSHPVSAASPAASATPAVPATSPAPPTSAPTPASSAPAPTASAAPPAASEPEAKATAASITNAMADDCGKTIGIWNLDRIPLTVYIYPLAIGVTKYKPHYPSLISRAFDEWSSATKGTFKFKLVNKLPADITVQFVNTTGVGRAGLAKNKSVNKELVHSEIVLAMENRFSDLEVLHCAEHEIGHVLGLNHSARSLGIMAPMLSGSEAVSISDADYLDLRKLYGLGEDGKQVKIETSQFDGFKKSVGAHLAARMKTLPHPLKKPCTVTLVLDSTGFMYHYDLTNDNADRANEIVAAITRSNHYPASTVSFVGKVKVKLTINADLSVASAEVIEH